MFLTKEQILNADDLETKEVKAFGGKILIRSLTAEEREELRKEVEASGQDLLKMMVKLVSLTVINEKKERLFTENDVEALSKKSAKELDKVFQVAQSLAGLGVVKETEKN
jgi:hypothetical protein|tara:strand:+ start:458 stop:787 length:330 start_codon:yes stop_codon:yes gene_type:complete